MREGRKEREGEKGKERKIEKIEEKTTITDILLLDTKTDSKLCRLE